LIVSPHLHRPRSNGGGLQSSGCSSPGVLRGCSLSFRFYVVLSRKRAFAAELKTGPRIASSNRGEEVGFVLSIRSVLLPFVFYNLMASFRKFGLFDTLCGVDAPRTGSGSGRAQPIARGASSEPYTHLAWHLILKIRIGFVLGSFFVKSCFGNRLQECGAISFFLLITLSGAAVLFAPAIRLGGMVPVRPEFF
jgi:hypothetical protein